MKKEKYYREKKVFGFLIEEIFKIAESENFSGKFFEKVRSKSETMFFQSDAQRLMETIVNSVYKTRDVFVRELISNSADASEKISDSTDEKLLVRIEIDRENGFLHFLDRGIGMTKNEMIEFLGTISKSTSDRISRQEQKDLIIGKFGVGFYSTFLVADQVFVTSKNDKDEQHIWQSDGRTFTVILDPRGNSLRRGTLVRFSFLFTIDFAFRQHCV